MKPRVLIVDDEPKMAASLAVALRREGYACHTAGDGETALAVVAEHGADVVITDRRMPGIDGVELMRRLRADRPELPVILITAYGDVRSAVAAMREGAFDYLTKPFDHDELRGLVARALELERLRRENRTLRRELGSRLAGDMVAESAAMRAVLEIVERAAPSDASVLIQGESGTGKELVAKRLHYQSGRASGPFVAVNCKAFAAGVLESELFGHEKGAFTDAHTARPGCFERADGGTLLLDEIGEVDPSFQAKLLRVLQEGEVLRVGASAPVAVDVRVVAATNRDLRAEIEAGRFREDLFYRLDVIPIRLPPLRQRREDILPLARRFLARFGDAGGSGYTLTADAEAVLVAHSWPGNVRELENVIERAVVLARGFELGPDDLLLEVPPTSHELAREVPPTSANDLAADPDCTLQAWLDRCTAERIRAALEAHRGRRADAARELGIDRSTLFRLMKRLDL